jgi:hypothetical protein
MPLLSDTFVTRQPLAASMFKAATTASSGKLELQPASLVSGMASPSGAVPLKSRPNQASGKDSIFSTPDGWAACQVRDYGAGPDLDCLGDAGQFSLR